MAPEFGTLKRQLVTLWAQLSSTSMYSLTSKTEEPNTYAFVMALLLFLLRMESLIANC